MVSIYSVQEGCFMKHVYLTAHVFMTREIAIIGEEACYV